MKVLYIHQYYRQPHEGGGIRSYYLTRELVKKGFQVDVITGYNGEEIKKENIEGVTVHFLPVWYDNSLGFKSRINAFLKFAWKAIRYSLKIKGVDVNYVMTTPLTTGLIALFLKFFRRTPYIFEVGDLWPKVPEDMGILKNRFLIILLKNFEKICYNNAKAIVALSPDIEKHISSLTIRIPIEVIPNIADINFFTPNENDGKEMDGLDLKNKFVISYTGTLGVANHLDYLLDAAQSIRELPIKILIVGDGACKDSIQSRIESERLTNVALLPARDKSGIKKVLDASDAIYISFKNNDSLATGSPNKLFDGLAAGKLIIINFQGWIKGLIQSNDCGFSYNPEKPAEFAEKILMFTQNPDILKSFQKNARQLAENSFSLQMLAERQAEFIRSLDIG